MYVKDFLGGLFTFDYDSVYTEENDYQDNRPVFMEAKDLMIGDILIIDDDDYETDTFVVGEKNYYLYIGNTTKDDKKVYYQFVTVDSDKKIVLLDERVTEKYYSYVKKANVSTSKPRSRLVDSLVGQNCFILLRPSYSKKIIDFGDVNSDMNVDRNDAEILATYIIDKKDDNYSINDLQLGDMNNDGSIKMNDAMRILKK